MIHFRFYPVQLNLKMLIEKYWETLVRCERKNGEFRWKLNFAKKEIFRNNFQRALLRIKKNYASLQKEKSYIARKST